MKKEQADNLLKEIQTFFVLNNGNKLNVYISDSFLRMLADVLNKVIKNDVVEIDKLNLRIKELENLLSLTNKNIDLKDKLDGEKVLNLNKKKIQDVKENNLEK